MNEKSYHHGDLRNALVAAGLELLERDGPQAVSLRAVARAACVSQAAPYAHFKSKRALMAAIAATGFERLSGRLEESVNDPAAGLRELGRDYVEFASENAGLYRLMFSSRAELDPEDAHLQRASAAAFQLFAQKTATGAGNPFDDPGPVAAWSLLHGFAMLLVDEMLHFAADHTLSGVLDLLEAGISAKVDIE